MTANAAPPGPDLFGEARLYLDNIRDLLKRAEQELARAKHAGQGTSQPGSIDEETRLELPATGTEIGDLGAQALYRRCRAQFPVSPWGTWKPWGHMDDTERAWFRGVATEVQSLKPDPPYLRAIRAAHEHLSRQDQVLAGSLVDKAFMELDRIIHPERYQ